MGDFKKKLSFFCPDQLTKHLSFQKLNDGRRLTISTNWLPLMGFEAGALTVERSLGQNQGVEIVRVRDLFSMPDETKKKVYQRSYNKRKNNPVETQLQLKSQKLLDHSFPADCTKAHITFTQDRVVIRPLSSHQQRAIENAKAADPLSVFGACTSGVDLYSMQSQGMRVESIIEFRPNESRDKTDLSETGAVNVLANIKGIKNVYNEDISLIDVNRLARDAAASPFTTFIISPVCDDYSNVKAKALKDRSLEDLSSGIDMGYDLLRIIDALAPPVVLIENVSGWINSDMYRIISLRLRRWGYKENTLIGDARGYGGLTSRKRAYSCFSALPAEFSWEEPQARRTTPIWDDIASFLPECRDVTHSKSLNDGLECGRLRLITEETCHSPTLLKSQLRMAKDSVAIQHDGKLFWPTEALMKFLMGIDEGFSLENCSTTIASEIIGQSVDMGLHDSVVRSVKRHILDFFSSLNPYSQFEATA